MDKGRLSDGEAKAILRLWPTRTKKLWPTPANSLYWIQAHPVVKGSGTRAPSLGPPGAKNFHTHPDGMWIYFDPKERFADVMTIEVCRTEQNYYDKRSRAYPLCSSLILYCSQEWFAKTIVVQKEGKWERWEACGSFSSPPSGDLIVPVRNCRTLIALPNDLYRQFKKQCPPGDEFYCRHSSLGTYAAPKMQKFLKGMALDNHFGTRF